VWIWGYVFFLWASYFWLGPEWVTPDLCVAVLVFLATALLFRIRRGRGNWFVFAGLGALLGLGYLAKAAMFPWPSFFCSALCAWAASQGYLSSGGSPHACWRLECCRLRAAACPGALGNERTGDVWRFRTDQLLGIYRSRNKNGPLAGRAIGTGNPAHPTRKILSDPAVYEFAAPIQGSYPPWYDPSYWYEGVRPHFLLKGQLWALFRAANMYLKIFSKSGALWAVLVRCGSPGKALAWGSFSPGAWLVILPSVAALAMYSLVLVEFRYVAPFALMLMLWTLARVRIVARRSRD